MDNAMIISLDNSPENLPVYFAPDLHSSQLTFTTHGLHVKESLIYCLMYLLYSY